MPIQENGPDAPGLPQKTAAKADQVIHHRCAAAERRANEESMQ
jgi:hypothetical protein